MPDVARVGSTRLDSLATAANPMERGMTTHAPQSCFDEGSVSAESAERIWDGPSEILAEQLEQQLLSTIPIVVWPPSSWHSTVPCSPLPVNRMLINRLRHIIQCFRVKFFIVDSTYWFSRCRHLSAIRCQILCLYCHVVCRTPHPTP